MYAAIRSTGCYVPEIEVPNAELARRFEEREPGQVAKLEGTTGIRTRFHAPPAWATSDLAVRAAEQALARAGVTPDEVDLILVGTDSPDYITPATSVVVQHKLGATRAGTFDVGCACASFPTALSAASGIMAQNPWMKNVLVIGAYMMHKLADPSDSTVFFYGDGAGAALLQPSSEPGLMAAAFRADGALAKSWGIYAGGTVEPASPEAIAAGRTQVRMLEKYPPEVNDAGWPAVARMLAERNRIALADVDLFVFTQVRRRTIEKVMTALEQPVAKAHTIMEKWGYTGSACVPMALHDAIVTGKARPGQLVLLIGSGVGYNQAGIALRLTDALAHQ
jgi:3-oxoacyl-[acyl-carrier-protein] synthase-3